MEKWDAIAGTESISITTFWVDWLLFPLLLMGAWLTYRWARSDSRLASRMEEGLKKPMPPWIFSVPLFIAAAAWVIAGIGTLIREDYWEMRIILGAFILWTLCCITGMILLIIIFIRRWNKFGTAGILNLVGLILMSILMILPGLIGLPSPDMTIIIGHLWSALLIIGVGLLTGAVILGFPYRFPRFSLGLGILFLIGWGFSEIALKQPSFPWMIRIWRPYLGLEYLNTFPEFQWWQIAGAFKVFAGIAITVILIISSRIRKTPKQLGIK